jgi:hypothetical protein
VTDEELSEFRKFLDGQLPQGSGQMSDAEIAGVRQLIDLAGNPDTAASLISEIDSLLNAEGSEMEAFLTGGGIGVRFDTAEDARSWLREFRRFFTEKRKGGAA